MRGGGNEKTPKLYPPVGIGSPFVVKPSEESLRKAKAIQNAQQEIKNKQAAVIRRREETKDDVKRFHALQNGSWW